MIPEAWLLIGLGLAALAFLTFVFWYLFWPPKCPNGCGRMELRESVVEVWGAYVRVWVCPKCQRQNVRRIPLK